jgi:pantoate--beta-alanine ligase
MQVIRKTADLRELIRERRGRGERIGFVPTMGNLHAGHYSLIGQARERSDCVVASIFVNPTQFGAGEDFARYPRTPDEDAKGLDAQGCDVLFLPEVESIYPLGLEQGVRVRVPGLGDILEGASRPGHFDGVATVVAKLFNLAQPDLAVFGSKDFQQLLVVRRMSADLAFPVEIVGAPIIREQNGLAMSSRNQFLDPGQREQAAVIHSTLLWMRERLGAEPTHQIETGAAARLAEAGLEPDYAVIRNAADLGEPGPASAGGRVALIAARLGSVRLIDNLSMPD